MTNPWPKGTRLKVWYEATVKDPNPDGDGKVLIVLDNETNRFIHPESIEYTIDVLSVPEDSVGTVRLSPEGIHAFRVSENSACHWRLSKSIVENETTKRWFLTDDEVVDWPVVYRPEESE